MNLRTAAQTRLTTILIWSIAVLAALFLVWPVWRAFFPMEIWGNEGWNAYHADQAMRGAAQLYPPPDGLVSLELAAVLLSAILMLLSDAAPRGH